MSDEQPAVPDSNAEAQRLVGSYFQDFATLESALDDGIGRLLGLEGQKKDVVCANLIFTKKLDVFFSAENFLATIPRSERLRRLKHAKSKTSELNNLRNVFAHSPFEGVPNGGVTFRRVVANGKLNVSNLTKTATEVEGHRAEARMIADELLALVAEMKPFEPSMDFSDPRNSMYLAIL